MADGDVAVLLGAGRDPVSSAARRGALDAGALEMALRLAGASVLALHAGNADEPSLVEYLGMGVQAIEVLPSSGGVGLARGLGDLLRRKGCRLVLAGARSEVGAGSGMLPYAVADALGATLVPHVTQIDWSRNHVRCTIAMDIGERRIVRAPLPVVATVGVAAPVPRPFAYGHARRGAIRVGPSIAADAQRTLLEAVAPRRLRPRYLDVVRGERAWDRIRQIVNERSLSGRRMDNVTPEAAAEALLAFMAAAGVWRSDSETQASEQRSDEHPVS